MGSLAKALGQARSALSLKSLESESASLFKGLQANKVPGSLSSVLDGTLKDGHDMKVFGLGTLAGMQSRERYQQFLTNMHVVYRAMEVELDVTSDLIVKTDAIRSVWQKHGQRLRRKARLEQDLQELQDLLAVDGSENAPQVSPKTIDYVERIRKAGELDRETGGGLLLGHLYCRYFADLFGGQMLGRPFQLALQLPVLPRHLVFNLEKENRKEYLEELYGDLNKAGKQLTPAQLDDVRKESISAFQHNAWIYSEDPKMVSQAVQGGMNLMLGGVTSILTSR
jgi:heme oxygenase